MPTVGPLFFLQWVQLVGEPTCLINSHVRKPHTERYLLFVFSLSPLIGRVLILNRQKHTQLPENPKNRGVLDGSGPVY